MNNVSIDLNSINKNIGVFNNSLKNYKDKIDELILNLKKFDNCWNDINTDAFITFVEKDELLYNEHISAIDEHVKFVQNFCDSLNKVFNEINDGETLQTLKYVKSYVDVSIENLNRIIFDINNAFNIYNSIRIPSNTKTYYDIAGLMNNISKEIIVTLKEQILDVKNKLINLLNDMKNEVQTLPFVEIDDSVCIIERNVE